MVRFGSEHRCNFVAEAIVSDRTYAQSYVSDPRGRKKVMHGGSSLLPGAQPYSRTCAAAIGDDLMIKIIFDGVLMLAR